MAFIREQLFDKDEPVGVKALSIGFGVFMGIVPIWGYQLIVGITLSHLMRLNKAIFIVAANISAPPLIPLVIYLSFVLGIPFVDEPIVDLLSVESYTLDSIKANIVQYLYGSVALAIASGLLAFVVSFFTISWMRTNKV